MPILPPQQNSNSQTGTGELEVTMFGKEAEKLLNLPANDLWQKYQEDTSFVHTFINSKLEEMLLQIEIQSKTFLKKDGNTILSYIVRSLDCQKTTLSLPVQMPLLNNLLLLLVCITYLVPTENANRNENLTTSTQDPPAHPEHDKDTSKSSRGRTLKAKKLD
ncbi:hypothetical protein OROMI_017053 [Orobanche minor]